MSDATRSLNFDIVMDDGGGGDIVYVPICDFVFRDVHYVVCLLQELPDGEDPLFFFFRFEQGRCMSIPEDDPLNEDIWAAFEGCVFSDGVIARVCDGTPFAYFLWGEAPLGAG